tara:strand:+ start:1446 stop:3209 length:1764 start_codon:yes stop_codon:yes gene_type:complete
MTKSMFKEKLSFNNQFNNDDFDVGQIISFYLRNKKFISIFTLITFLFSLLYAFNAKKVWEGQFQIVIKSEGLNNNPLMSLNPSLQSLTGITGGPNSYETEVGILQSPSVLMPVFDFVSSNKKSKDKNTKLVFADWINDNLNVELVRRTSILNISYRDTDKTIIIPVLKKISSSYQKYSTGTKKRKQELAKNFLKEQIVLFKEKSSKSLKEAQEFAIDQDLLFYNQNNKKPFQNIGNNIIDNNKIIGLQRANLNLIGFDKNSFEDIRVQSANEIKKIDLQLKAIKEVGSDSTKLKYLGYTMPALIEEGLPLALSKIEQELALQRSKYTDSDIFVKRLIEEKDLLIKELKKRTIGILNAQRAVAESRMISSQRPKDVLLKYKDLTRKAYRDESTLVDLEDQLSVIKLEEARQDDPWKLITKPTLLLDEVAPSKPKIGILGLIFGLIFGTLIVFYQEFKKGLIFDKKKLEDYLDASVIEEISINELDDNSEKAIFLRDYLSLKSTKSLCFINLDNINNLNVDNLKKIINQVNSKINIFDITSLTQLNDDLTSDKIFLISKIGFIRVDEINLLKKRLDIFNKKISGIILFT